MTATFKKFSEVEMALSQVAVGEALGVAGFERPTLYISPHEVGLGHQIACQLNMNLALHDCESTTLWFIECNGQRLGSWGC